MRIFVSGATGFIGAPLVARLLDAGHEVAVWVRSIPRAREAVDPRARFVELTDDDDDLDREMRGCEAVISLAGSPVIQRWTAETRALIVSSRVDLTRRIAAAINRVGTVKVLLSASGVGYYGSRGDEVLEEGGSAGDDFLAQVCVDWEAAAAEANTRVACARIGLVLGPGGGALEAMLGPFKAGIGGKLAGGRQFMPWIHLDDLHAMFERALTDDTWVGPFNAVGPEPVRNVAFTKALGRALHRPTFAPVPAFALRVLYGEAAAPILASQRALPTAARERGFEFEHTDLDAALAHVLGRT